MNYHLLKTKYLPIGAVGTSLGFMTLANVWGIHNVHFLKPIAITFALIALGLMLTKIILHPKQVWKELKDPFLGGYYPTIDMASFVLAGYLLPYYPRIAKTIWLVGIVVHLSIFVFFFTLRLKKFTLKSMIPSWNVVLVGVCVAGVGSKGMGFPEIANFLTWFGIVLYVPFYPIMLYRVYVHKHKIEAASATSMGIMAAPSSLVLASYLTTSTTHISWILIYLAFSSILNVLLVYIELPKFIKKGFNPGFAAFTFPLAISMLAMWKMSELTHKLGSNGYLFFKTVSNIELVIGSCIIAYVAINFIILLVKALIRKEHEVLQREKDILLHHNKKRAI